MNRRKGDLSAVFFSGSFYSDCCSDCCSGCCFGYYFGCCSDCCFGYYSGCYSDSGCSDCGCYFDFCSGYSYFYLHISWVIPKVGCPKNQDLSLALKRILTMSPAMIATVIPPAVAFNPPVRMPRNPFSSTASVTPFAKV